MRAEHGTQAAWIVEECSTQRYNAFLAVNSSPEVEKASTFQIMCCPHCTRRFSRYLQSHGDDNWQHTRDVPLSVKFSRAGRRQIIMALNKEIHIMFLGYAVSETNTTASSNFKYTLFPWSLCCSSSFSCKVRPHRLSYQPDLCSMSTLLPRTCAEVIWMSYKSVSESLWAVFFNKIPLKTMEFSNSTVKDNFTGCWANGKCYLLYLRR